MTVLQVVGRRLFEAILLEACESDRVAAIAAALGAGGRWRDTDYVDDGFADWGAAVHLDRVHRMAVAYARGDRSVGGVVTVATDHGARPYEARYGYIVDPGTAEPNCLDQGRPVVIANRPDLQAVWHPEERLGQLAFHRPGRCVLPSGTSVEVDRPLLVQISTAADRRVAIADPRRQGGTVRLTLDGHWPRTVSLPGGDQAGGTVIVGSGSFPGYQPTSGVDEPCFDLPDKREDTSL